MLKPADPSRFTVHLVGAGPGDPELLTLKAARVLQQATLALVDDLVNPGCLKHLAADCRIVSVGKRGGCASTPQDFIERLMVYEALRGERVVRLKGGDPLVFGRAGEEIAALRAAGLQVEIVPGITAGMAAAAAARTSLTHRHHAPGVAFITGHRQPDGSPLRWAALAQSGLTLAIYMGVAEASSIEAGLLQGGLPPETPAMLVQAASCTEERLVATRLADLCKTIQTKEVGSPCVMLIGEALQEAVQLLHTPNNSSWSEDAVHAEEHVRQYVAA
ncbi:uroporphyrinogen-III C-methyltransferase [Thiomonas sp.]|jgi:uroporphyrin-III C-methyltransferase|uniref:uroporphyrinogen-III C-methyltransferase n=1 Tax=Thiomonas sp. TaxID=2047785 RepID=UPI00258C93BE|nr:uroporphyrinogen-III C-methyltransferase [Thiomonas sp.]